MVWAAVAAPIAVAMAGHANAQTPTISYDKVVVPNLTFTADAESEKNYWKYNYFHKSGVSFDTALADIRECRLRSHVSTFGEVGGFVPYSGWAAGPATRAEISSPIAGVVGGLIVGAAVASTMEVNRRFNMHECMSLKNYRQYGLPKDIWRQINPDDPAMGDAIQARIASGPAPTAEALR